MGKINRRNNNPNLFELNSIGNAAESEIFRRNTQYKNTLFQVPPLS